MIRDYTERQRKTEEYFRRDFQLIGEPEGNGFSFSCDADGNLTGNDAQDENFRYAVSHPDKFADRGVVCYKRTYMEPASGTCRCGEKVYLTNEYMGACECPKCGQWYNLFGQELLPPEAWGNGGAY